MRRFLAKLKKAVKSKVLPPRLQRWKHFYSPSTRSWVIAEIQKKSRKHDFLYFEIEDRFSREVCQLKGLAPGIKAGSNFFNPFLNFLWKSNWKFSLIPNQQRTEPLDCYLLMRWWVNWILLMESCQILYVFEQIFDFIQNLEMHRV